MKEKRGYSRRDFLKVVGASAGLASAGCKPEVPEKLIPYVVQPDEIVPGVSTWYSGTCDQCSVGCGWVVRTREGRALKVEGNEEHPINKGGLCAVAQSSLQELYDPDRVRKPLTRDPLSQKKEDQAFRPASWKDALGKVAEAVEKLPAGKSAVVVTKPLTGSLKSLVRDLTQEFPKIKHVTYDPEGRDIVDVATEQVFGPGARASFNFKKADVVVGVGADYLETWQSPVEYSRQWAHRRTPGHYSKSYVVHFEPRLSLTGANADRWIRSTPGTDTGILLALLKEVTQQGGLKKASPSDRGLIRRVLSSNKFDSAALDIPEDALKDIAKRLVKAKHSLVIAGGASSRVGSDGVESVMLAHLLNAALGNIGSTVNLRREAESAVLSDSSMSELIGDLSSEDPQTKVVMLCDINPAYLLSKKSGFREAVASLNVDLVVSATKKLDETARLAHVVLPLSTSFEAWGDSESRPNVLNLNQPSMQPLYETQSLGDTLIALGGMLGKKFGEALSFKDYMQAGWARRTGGSWTKQVQDGGQWPQSAPSSLNIPVATSVANKRFAAPKPKERAYLMAFPTVLSASGNTANRPWMQEIPDPISSVVWDSWVELHPLRAKKYGVGKGDLLQLSTEHGAFEAPVLITDQVHPNVVAVPVGQGHESYGRYANGIGVNALSVLGPIRAGAPADRMAELKSARPGVQRSGMVAVQEFYKQFDRGALRTVEASKVPMHHGDSHGKKNGHGGDKHHDAEHHGDEHHGGHHDLLALGPQAERKQMYVQMRHPVYRWGMTIDLASCTGCSACVVACYAENNIPVVGKELCSQGREMSWLRVDHYRDGDDPERPITGFQPMTCQHCNNAPCEPVCPVYATYHNEQGLNTMVYNRCVGTRYCSNNCSYKVRRFNWFKYDWPEPLNWQLNPDVTVREVGVMEKCTFCVQRIREAENVAKNEGRLIKDGEVKPACASSCPTGAIDFGNLKDEWSRVARSAKSERGYKVLDSHINTQPAITYLARVTEDGKHEKHHSEV